MKSSLRRRRAVLIFWIAILGLGYLALDRWAAEFEPWLAQRLSREAGRPVRIADLGYRPFFGARLARVEIEGLGAAEGVSIDLAARRLFRGELHLDGFDVDSASLHLARDTEGRWNFEGLFPNADSTAPPAFARVRIARLAVEVETEATFRGSVEVAPGPDGRFELAGRGDLAARGIAARIAARGRVGPSGASGTIEIESDSPSVRANLTVEAETEIRVAGPFSGALEIEVGRLSWEGTGSAVFARDGSPREVEVRSTWARLARSDSFSVSMTDAVLRATPPPDSVAGRWSLRVEGSGGIRPDLLGETARFDLDGRVDSEVRHVRLDRLVVTAPSLRAEVRGRIDPKALALEVSLSEASLERSLALVVAATGRRPLGPISAGGSIEGAFRFDGPFSDVRWSGRWRIPRGRFALGEDWVEVRDSQYRVDDRTPFEVEMEGYLAAGRGETRVLEDARIVKARIRPSEDRIEVVEFDLQDDAFHLICRDGTYGDYTSLRLQLFEVRLQRLLPLARRVAAIPDGLRASGSAGGEVTILRPTVSDSFQILNGTLQLADASIRLSEDPPIRLAGITGRIPVSLRPRGGGETVEARARTASMPSNLSVARIEAGPIEITGARFAASLDGRELRVENGSFVLAGGRGEIAGIVSFREGREVRTALLGRVRGLQLAEVYDKIQPFEGELTGPADAEFQFAMEGARLVNLHAPIRASAGGRIGARLLREFSEKLADGSVKMGLQGLSQFTYKNFRVDLDLARDYYDRATARNKFDPPLSETIRDEILMEVGFDGPMPVWGPIFIDVDLKVVGMQLNLLLERIRRNRGTPTPPAGVSAPPPPASASDGGETPPASGDAPRSAPAPPR